MNAVTRAEQAAFRDLSPAQQLRALRGQRVERVFQVERAGIDEEARTVWLSIASERPYERWWGIEILDHSPGSIRDERLRSGAPLLVGHDTSDQVGVVEKFEITANKRLRILARFSRSSRAEEIWRDVLDGIRRNTSVGYVIHDLRLEKSENGVNTYRVTDWEPLEGSLVAVPADPSVGLGRNLKGKQIMQGEELEMEQPGDSPHKTRSQRRHEEADRNAEAERIAALLKAGDAYKDLGGQEVAREVILAGGNVDTFKLRMADKMRGTHRPTNMAQAGGSYFGEGARHSLPRSKVFERQEDAHFFGQWVRGQLFGSEQAQSWLRDQGYEVRAMTTAISTAGGYLVPEEVSGTIIDLADKYGAFRANSVVWPMKSDTLSVPKSTQDPEATFVSEGGSIPEKDPSYGSVNLVAKKIGVIVRASTELIEDSPISVADDVAMKIGRSFAKKEDECGFLGDGTSTYGGMRGIFWQLIQGSNAGAVNAAAGHDTFLEIDHADLMNVMAALPEYALEGAKWYCSGKANALVFQRLLLGANGNAASDIAGALPRFYAGYPIVTSPVLPSSTGTINGTVMLLFGHLGKSSKMGLRREIRVKILDQKYADTDEVGIQATERFHIVNHDVGTPTVAGPIVGLVGKTS